MTYLFQRGHVPGPAPTEFGLRSSPHPEFGTLFVSCQPWWAPMGLPATGRGLLLSHQTWLKGEWCDGPIVRWEAGEITDIVLPGGPLEVELGPPGPALGDLEAWLAEERFFALKQSLAHGLRLRAGGGLHDGVELRAEAFTLDTLLSLLLVRFANPQHQCFFNAPDQAWRRLAQNLNIALVRSGDRPRASIPLIEDWGSRETVRELLRWQKSKSPFIPQHLWDRLSAW